MRSIRKGLFISVVVLMADVAISALAAVSAQLSTVGVLGDLLLIEVGLFAILGGLIEFSRSRFACEVRRLTLRSKEEFSTEKHAEASKGAVVLFSTTLVLFLLLIILVLLE